MIKKINGPAPLVTLIFFVLQNFKLHLFYLFLKNNSPEPIKLSSSPEINFNEKLILTRSMTSV